MLAAKVYPLAGSQLGPLAGFHPAIDPGFTGGDGRMGGTAGTDQADRLEQLIELDVFATNDEVQGHAVLHGVTAPASGALSGRIRYFHARRPFMTSPPAPPEPSALLGLPRLPASASGLAPLLQLARRTQEAARDDRALQPIHTECAQIVDGGLPFSLRWVSSLARKNALRNTRPLGAARPPNPFLPPDPRLSVAAVGKHHLAVLNKFPVIDDHLLLVTRRFEAQTAPLTAADWAVLAAIVAAHGGLGFYNGGAEAGASQAHRHLQWVPQATPGTACALAAFTASLDPQAIGIVQRQAALPWRHAFVARRLDVADDDKDATELHQAWLAACVALGLAANADPMPPCNLLLSRQWLLLVPRRCEKWQGISVNALGYAGSLFAADRAHIDRLRALGPLALLQAVALPR